MKKALVILLSAIMVMSLAACGGKEDSKTSSTATTTAATTAATTTAATTAAETEAEADEADADEEEDTPEEQAYTEAMSEFATSYEELMTTTGELLSSYDGSQEWLDAFAALYEASTMASTQLTAIAADVPEAYQESHNNVTAAIDSFNAVMMGCAKAIDAYESGDEAGGDALMGEVETSFQAAGLLWEAAFE